MKRLCVLAALLLCLCPFFEALAESSGIEWSFDTSTLTTADGVTLSTISVSPSGRYIVCADRNTVNTHMRNAAGAANPMGRIPDTLYLFEKNGEGYEPYKSIPIDTENMLELSSMIGGGSVFEWSADESRAVIAADWSQGSSFMGLMLISHSNLFLLDIESESFTRLTDVSENSSHCVLARWTGETTVRYLYSSLETNLQWNGIREIDIANGQNTPVADLFNDEGRVTTIYSWDSFGETIYYAAYSYNPEGTSGLYASEFRAFPENARCLVNTSSELIETEKQPYSQYGFSKVEISADGKWACLTVADRRIQMRDFPLADSETMPQSDPSNAVSAIDGRPWVPCHDVFLYDLENEQLVDPFTDQALDPAKAVVTAACFADDGQTLVCTVFGDDGEWTIDDFSKAGLWYVNLSDFSVVRASEIELDSDHWFPYGITMLSGGVLSIPSSTPPYTPIQLFKPLKP